MATAVMPSLVVHRRPPLSLLEMNSRGIISFRHPGYEGPNLLFTFPRVDSITVADATPIYGIYHRSALLACQIVAGNAFDNEYYFVVDGFSILYLFLSNYLY